jgi:hypothetical protein
MVGYDVRWFPPGFLTSRWDAALRMKYLLRPGIVRPFSVGKTVWPSRFQVGEGERDVFSGYPENIRLDPDENTHFYLFGLWDSYGEMLANYKPASEPAYVLGAGLLRKEQYPADAGFKTDEWWRAIHGSPIDPPEPKGEWNLLGYDVANSGLTSAMTNFSLPEAELALLREKWAGGINDHGLFSAADEAVRFCLDANVRLADEGPFYVWELFLITSHMI